MTAPVYGSPISLGLPVDETAPVITSADDSSGRKAPDDRTEPGMIFGQGVAPVDCPLSQKQSLDENLHQRRPNVICYWKTHLSVLAVLGSSGAHWSRA